MDNEKSTIRTDNLRDRYFHDTKFRVLVDSMLNIIKDCQFTPFELLELSFHLKQALILALIMYEEQKLRPYYIPEKEELEREARKRIKQLFE